MNDTSIEASAIGPGPHASTRSPHPDVLLIIDHLGHGGAQRVLCNLANALNRRGYRVRIILTTKREPNNALELDLPIEIGYLLYAPLKRSFAHLAGLFRLCSLLPKLRSRIRNSRAPCVVSFIRPTNVTVLLACLGLHGQRIVICERNDPARQALGRHWALLSWLLYRTADLVTFNSEGVRATLARYVPQRKLAYVPNVLTTSMREDREALAGPAILAVGRVVPQKGYDVLIKAFAWAGDQLSEWRIVFLGEGPEAQNLQSLARDLGVDDRIEWRGHVADTFAYYRASKIFALTSRYEGMPNALLEAMSCGLPAVVSDASPGPMEVIKHDVNGLVVPTEDVDATAVALSRLAENADLRERLGLAARHSVAAFQPEHAIEQWVAVLGLPNLEPTGDRAPAQPADSGFRPEPNAGTLGTPDRLIFSADTSDRDSRY